MRIIGLFTSIQESSPLFVLEDLPPSGRTKICAVPNTSFNSNSNKMTNFSLSFQRIRRWMKNLKFYYDKTDLALLAYSMIYFLICSFLVSLANATVDQKGVNKNYGLDNDDVEILYDKGLETLSKISSKYPSFRKLPEYFISISLFLAFVRCLLLKKGAVLVIRRFFYICGTVYLIRAPTVLMTVLPYSYKGCPKNNDKENIFIYALKIMIQNQTSCGDVFFSGHSIFITEMALLWITYSKNIFISFPAILISICGLFSIITAGYHYSIDVFFGALVVIVIHWLYHWNAQNRIWRTNWFGILLRRADGEINQKKQTSKLRCETFENANNKTSISKLPNDIESFSINNVGQHEISYRQQQNPLKSLDKSSYNLQNLVNNEDNVENI